MTTSELPYFPVTVPDALDVGSDALLAMLDPVLRALADVVDASQRHDPGTPTPCADFDLAALRDHVLGWLQYFAAALADPRRDGERPDPMAYRAADDSRALREVVRAAAATMASAIRAGVATGDVVLSQARMSGAGALGMVLGEYLVHGWDLARAIGRPWNPPAVACEAALEFFRGMITSEYRGGDGGFFAAEVSVAPGAPALDRLLGFAGRDPGWAPPTPG